MGFLNGGNEGKKGPTFYLEVTDTPKLVRPLDKAPQSVWGHSIPEVKTLGPDGKPVSIRRYSFEICTSTSRSGAGCQCCTTQDPLWHMLDQKTKTNKKGQRVDFPKKPVHLLPVLEMATGAVKLLKGGNGTYKEMDAWFDLQNPEQKNLGRCEWGIYKTGVGMLTNYHVVRSDATPFTPTSEQLAEAKSVVQQGLKDMAPADSTKFLQTISGEGYAPMPEAAPASATGHVLNIPQLAPQLVPLSAPASFEPVSAPAPLAPVSAPAPLAPVSAPNPAPAQAAAPAGNTNVLAEFTAWLSAQPEFQGVGILQNLVPVLKAQLGDVNYHKCSPEQIVALRTSLTAHLEQIRTKKA